MGILGDNLKIHFLAIFHDFDQGFIHIEIHVCLCLLYGFRIGILMENFGIQFWATFHKDKGFNHI